MGHDINTDKKAGTDLLERTKRKVDKPRLHKVVLLNDDYTPMDFVVIAIMKVFHKPFDEAERLTLEIHQSGKAVGGVYTLEVAEQKVIDVMDMAKAEEHPFRASAEPE